ncbi:MAG: HIT domain-containing protein [DPANN group archaeon]|nr:HIT domain-containing protein [DPANN group archaeon]
MTPLSPEMKAQLEEQKKQCLFCRIIAGEIPAKKAYEDSRMVAILDINPAVRGHLLLMPKEHHPILPYLPPDEFAHLFGRLPQIVSAAKSSLAASGVTIIIANGYAAGQQSPHLLFHLLPREQGDQADLALNSSSSVGPTDQGSFFRSIKKTLSPRLERLRDRTDATPKGEVKTAGFLAGKKIGKMVAYEDRKALVTLAPHPLAKGHLIIFSQEEPALIERLSPESMVYLMNMASLAATTVFESLQAQGTNIIIRSGKSDDNPEGILDIHIIPRWTEDSLGLQPRPMEQPPDQDQILDQLREEMILIEQEKDVCQEKDLIDLDNREEAAKEEDPGTPEASLEQKAGIPLIPKDPADEIKEAIGKIQKR